jgi:hypothetical protein
MMPPQTPGERKTVVRRHESMGMSLRSSYLVGLGLLVVLALVGRSSRAAEMPLVVETKAPAASTADSVEWSLSGAAGPVLAGITRPSAGVWPLSFGLLSTAWQLDLQRRRKNEQFVAGVSLEGTYDHEAGGAGQQLLGADAFIGNDWRHRHWTLEATIGAGVEAAQVSQQDVVAYSNSNYNVSGFVYHPSYQLGFYAQGALAAAVPLSSAVEVLIRLGVHLTGAHDEDWFAASTIGLRYRLP